MRTYQELSKLKTFEERFNYLKLDGSIGNETFGYDRYINQYFYRSVKWKKLRSQIIVRDFGSDLGLPEYPIRGSIIIHHMNPIEVKDIQDFSDKAINPNYLICVSIDTHNAIHWGIDIGDFLRSKTPVERQPNDTCLWRD